MNQKENTHFRLLASCPDRTGVVAKVAAFLADRGGSITEASQFYDSRTGMFFLRSEFSISGGARARILLDTEFEPLARELDMTWRLTDADQRHRVVLLVSRFDHCLAYLLHRRKVGDLSFDVPCVISNHEDLRELVEWHGIHYHHVPVPAEASAKRQGLTKTAELIDAARPDTIVLARYMQIFPPWLCERYRNRVINIHHSFLPSFLGAKPYHQAEERGVKLIGATCHYVTEELDAGPIIEQDVVRVRHSHGIKDMMRLGKDVENVVLARGLRYHLEDRVIVHQNRTVVFHD